MKVLDRLFAGKDQLLDVGKAVSQHNKEQRKQVRDGSCNILQPLGGVLAWSVVSGLANFCTQKGKGRGGDRDGGKWKKGGKGKALNSKPRGGPSPKRS
jgi:hypothetical protein